MVILLDRNVCLKQRLEFFDAVVAPVAFFAAGHRAIFHADIRQFDVEFRRLLRRIVGPPADIQWDMTCPGTSFCTIGMRKQCDTGKVCAPRPGDMFVCVLAGTLRGMLLVDQTSAGMATTWETCFG